MSNTPEPDRAVYSLEPTVSIGPLALGQPAPRTEGFRDAVEVQIHRFMPAEIHFSSLGLRLSPDREGVIREITVVEPGQVRWRGIDLLGRTFGDVVRDLRKEGVRVRTSKGIEAEAPELGVSLWADDGVVTSVTASDPAHPMPTPTIQDVAKAYGMTLPDLP